MKTCRPILTALALALLAPAGCKREDMHNQPRHEWQEPSDFFADGQAARPQVEGTMHRTQLASNSPLLTTRKPDSTYVAEYPFEITRGALEHGRKQYDIYCSMCHGSTGYGDGMIVRRGFVRPPSFHLDRLREAPPGYVVEVITHGFGAMYSYNDRIMPEDRWKIAAYVKTLQLSQGMELASLSPQDRQRVDQAPVARPQTAPATQPGKGGQP